ncbi:vacuolar protein sorting-associated protein 37A-like [Macrosteles quadrilineatus]|uniref:vacuolar protein sorting-associated protein 37A-like n=1 Tax=Macrosteles quadrilineatus TaxID=74068 RepID=UPI0023E0944C|nr:vacuolar protein sorting-associated protein 37A-like [Macrosteles quadrilineatus]
MLPTMFDNILSKRRRQIDTLKIFNANVSEVKEDSEYRVDFISGSNNLSLLVILGPDFPLEKPVLKIVPAVQHPWVTENGEVTGAPGLLNFTVHSDLGRVVQAIVRELELRPPPLLGGTVSPPCTQRVDISGPMSPNNYGYSGTPPGVPGFSNYRPSMLQNPAKHMSVAFPELNSLSVAELEQLNSSADYLDEFVDSLPVMKEIDRTMEEWITRNEEVATETLSKEGRLQQLRSGVSELWDSASQLKGRHEALNQEYQRLADKYSPQSIRQEVKRAAVRSDEESELIAEKFLNGDVDLDSFLPAYIEKRMLSYCRKTKEEKLSHQLQKLERAGF